MFLFNLSIHDKYIFSWGGRIVMYFLNNQPKFKRHRRWNSSFIFIPWLMIHSVILMFGPRSWYNESLRFTLKVSNNFPIKAFLHPEHLRSWILIKSSTLYTVSLMRQRTKKALLTPLIYTCDRIMLHLKGPSNLNDDSKHFFPTTIPLFFLVLFVLVIGT